MFSSHIVTRCPKEVIERILCGDMVFTELQKHNFTFVFSIGLMFIDGKMICFLRKADKGALQQYQVSEVYEI